MPDTSTVHNALTGRPLTMGDCLGRELNRILERVETPLQEENIDQVVSGIKSMATDSFRIPGMISDAILFQLPDGSILEANTSKQGTMTLCGANDDGAYRNNGRHESWTFSGDAPGVSRLLQELNLVCKQIQALPPAEKSNTLREIMRLELDHMGALTELYASQMRENARLIVERTSSMATTGEYPDVMNPNTMQPEPCTPEFIRSETEKLRKLTAALERH